MKASELRPGQWFEYQSMRFLCVGFNDDGEVVFVHRNGSRLEFDLDYCELDIEVTDCPQCWEGDEKDDKLEAILAQMNGTPDMFRECVGNPLAVLARICRTAEWSAKRARLPAWSIIGKWTGHGSGVSAAIYEYYRKEQVDE